MHPYDRPRFALLVTVALTALIGLIARVVPTDYAATAVGLAFLGATYWLVWRRPEPEPARRTGLTLGGLFDTESIPVAQTLRDLGRAAAWAFTLGLIVLPPFWLGFLLWYAPEQRFVAPPAWPLLDEALGQVLVVALPEEAFFRGYLQSNLERAWPARQRWLGARLGRGALVASLLFALGHFVTEPEVTRLAVFFPSLLFAWLRARTGGIGAAVLFHALCNLFASFLGQGYGLYGT